MITDQSLSKTTSERTTDVEPLLDAAFGPVDEPTADWIGASIVAHRMTADELDAVKGNLMVGTAWFGVPR